MIPLEIYPTEPWPISNIEKHPCVRLFVALQAQQDLVHDEVRALNGLMKILLFISENHARFAAGAPLCDVLLDIPVQRYDFIIKELKKMRLMQLKMVDGENWLIPCTIIVEPPKSKLKVFSYNLPDTLGEIIKDEARVRSITQSKLIQSALLHYLEAFPATSAPVVQTADRLRAVVAK